MAGKMCDGSANLASIRESHCFCEGFIARTGSTTPTSPYTAGTPEDDAWDRGVAAKAAETTPDENMACCAPAGAKAT